MKGCVFFVVQKTTQNYFITIFKIQNFIDNLYNHGSFQSYDELHISYQYVQSYDGLTEIRSS